MLTNNYTGYYELDCGTTATTLGSKWKTYISTGSTTAVNYKAVNYKTGTCYEYEYDNGWPKITCSVYSATTTSLAYTAECNYGYTTKWNLKPLTYQEKEKQLKDKFSKIIQNRCCPNVFIRQNSKRQPLPMTADIREQRARETLRRVVGEQKFINFMKHGFISVKGKSELVYQIFTGHGITHVFDRGNLVERLCVVLQGGFPPTDSLIMRYLLILNNEQQFRSLAIKHSIYGFERSRQTNGPVDMKSLAEIFKELKAA